MPTIFFSQRLDALAEILAEQLQTDGAAPLENRTVLIPNPLVKQWLSLELAKKNGISMGIRFLTVQEWIYQNKSFPRSLELFFLIYSALSECSEAKEYLEEKESRQLDLTEHLVSLFFKYGQYGKSLFEKSHEIFDWQQKILQKIFVEGPWRTPVQTAVPFTKERLHCFGIDILPPIFWNVLFQNPSLSLYLFSPCIDFWEDLCSEREQKNLKKYWRKKGASSASLRQLDSYLKDAPSLLSNWGKIGRETLKAVDPYLFEGVEAHLALSSDSLLKGIQSDLLYFQRTEERRKIDENDRSIRISLTGSSRLREVEVLRDEILRLADEAGVKFQEISVLAPDIALYAPLIEFVFAEADIPYRIFGLDIRSRSSFSQGFSRLAGFACSRWSAEELLSLFETPAFYRKQKWDGEKLERLRAWIDYAHVEWGLDPRHRQKILTETLGLCPSATEKGSWEKGWDRLLNRTVFLFPESGSNPLQIGWDELEEFLVLFQNLKQKINLLSGEKTLASWADILDVLAGEFLSADLEDDADKAAFHSFLSLLQELRDASSRIGTEETFPFPAIQRLFSRPCPAQIHASCLHGVRFSHFEEGAAIPAKAVFLVGLDETSLPRRNVSSSLDLLIKNHLPNPPLISDEDRYLFLKALFSAQEFLRISYGHLTADEGKTMGASLLVQELLAYADASFVCDTGKISKALTITHPFSSFDIRCFSEEAVRNFSKRDFLTAQTLYTRNKQELSFWPSRSDSPMPEGEITIPIAHLKLFASHPWKFYLQKIQDIYLDEEWEDSIYLQKNRCLRSSLHESIDEVLKTENFPLGIFGEAICTDIIETSKEAQKQLKEWNVESLFSLHFLENCKEIRWEKGEGKNQLRCEMPPIEVIWENRLKVKLTGEIKNASKQGLLAVSEDQIDKLLKIWPESLVASIALNTSQIFFLKSGRVKTLSDPEKNLKDFLEYYFLCLASPSPLLPEWADPILRKGISELEKKMESSFSERRKFDDPILEWMSSRMQLPSAKQIMDEWGSIIKHAFSGLADLYPTRGKKEGNYEA